MSIKKKLEITQLRKPYLIPNETDGVEKYSSLRAGNLDVMLPHHCFPGVFFKLVANLHIVDLSSIKHKIMTSAAAPAAKKAKKEVPAPSHTMSMRKRAPPKPKEPEVKAP